MKAKNIIIASIASVTSIAIAAIAAVVYVHKAIDKIQLNDIVKDK